MFRTQLGARGARRTAPLRASVRGGTAARLSKGRVHKTIAHRRTRHIKRKSPHSSAGVPPIPCLMQPDDHRLERTDESEEIYFPKEESGGRVSGAKRQKVI